MKKMLIFFVAFASIVSGSGDFLMAGYSVAPSAIAAGRGASGVALSEDGGYSFVNPAGVLNASGDRLFFSHANLFQSSRSEHFNITARINEFPFGVSLYYRHLGVAPVILDGSDYNEDNTYAAYDAAISVGSGFIKRGVKFGLSLRLMQESVWHYSNYAVALDGGVISPLLFDRLTLGASFINLGYAGKMDNEKFPLLSLWRAGAAYVIKKSSSINIKSVADIKVLSDGSVSLPLGLEGGNRWLIARAGWNLLHDTESFSAGFSLVFSSFQFDYAFVHYTNNLTDNSQPQFFSLSLYFY